MASWPYNFPLSNDFVKSKERGALKGQLLVHDRYTTPALQEKLILLTIFYDR